jgi:hypothetical protein
VTVHKSGFSVSGGVNLFLLKLRSKVFVFQVGGSLQSPLKHRFLFLLVSDQRARVAQSV